MNLWKRSINVRVGLLYLLPSIVLFGMFVYYPMAKTIYLSFFLTNQNGVPVYFNGIENYTYIFTSDEFRNSMKATLLFVAYTVPVSVVLALIMAVLANEKLKGIGLYRTIFSSTMGISVAASAVVWLFLFHPSVGAFNNILKAMHLPTVQWLLDPDRALLSVSLTTIWMNLGFNFLVILGGLQNIDDSLYESATIDGAGYFTKLRRITIPLLSPTLFFIITISLINAFQSFGQIDILTKGGPIQSTNLVVYSIYKEAFVNYQFGTASAQAIVLFIVVLIVTILQFKFGERKVHYQ
ncbi:carbohydrate ABC transporter permease [Lysinibacillus sp. KU-BSD001]|uniref:carbohydrate ABC transporter permease n=1 Tax=Lysinibacillus sp. KU-BSD001 TaxID=3141328 RepID=UPI0036F3865E